MNIFRHSTGLNPANPPLTLNYSASDNTQYHVFIDSDGDDEGYKVTEVTYGIIR